MRGRFQLQAAMPGSKASSASSTRALRNWIVKNGLPAVFSNTRPAKGRARSGSVCSGRLLTDDEGKVRDEIDHELAVRAKRLLQSGAPSAHFRVALAEDLMDKTLEGLGQRRIGDVTLVLVELAGSKEAARRHQSLVQLIDERGLSDTGISGHEHELRRALIDHPIERRDQRPDLPLASGQLLTNHESVR